MPSESDLLVPFDAAMFRLAFEASGMTQAELRRRVGELCLSKATLSKWCSDDPPTRVSRSALELTASELHVPLDRLKGAATGFYPGCGPDEVHPLDQDPFFELPDVDYSVDENWVTHAKDRERTGRHLGWPTAYHVVWAAFYEGFLCAYHRDLRNLSSPAHQLNRPLLSQYRETQSAVDRRLVLVLQRQISLTWSRLASLALRSGPLGLMTKSPAVEPNKEQIASMVRFAREGAASLRLRFGPWINGQEPIDYSALADLYRINLQGLGSPADNARTQSALEAAGFFD